MKKVLNFMGIFFSIILSIVLTTLMTCYALILNAKIIVSKQGITRTFISIDFAENIKNVDSGKFWNDVVKEAKAINITEPQLTEMLNNKRIKGELAHYVNKAIESLMRRDTLTITEDELRDLVDLAIDEFNKTNDNKISENKKTDIINAIDAKTVSSINASLEDITIDEDTEVIDIARNVLFGSYSVIVLSIIIGVIALIALFRASYYKWLGYTAVSGIVSSIIITAGIILISVFKIENNNQFIQLFKNMIVSNLVITAVIILVLSIILFIVHHHCKKNYKNDTNIDKLLETI